MYFKLVNNYDKKNVTICRLKQETPIKEKLKRKEDFNEIYMNLLTIKQRTI